MVRLRRFRSLDEIRAVCTVDPTFGCWIADEAKTAISDTSNRPIAINAQGRIVSLYKVSIELAQGPITEAIDLVIEHRCREERCCRPLHLLRTTKSENEKLKSASFRRRITKCPRGHALDDRTRLLSRRGGVLCRQCVSDDRLEFKP